MAAAAVAAAEVDEAVATAVHTPPLSCSLPPLALLLVLPLPLLLLLQTATEA